jgi:hypothetical protein
MGVETPATRAYGTLTQAWQNVDHYRNVGGRVCTVHNLALFQQQTTVVHVMQRQKLLKFWLEKVCALD